MFLSLHILRALQVLIVFVDAKKNPQWVVQLVFFCGSFQESMQKELFLEIYQYELITF